MNKSRWFLKLLAEGCFSIFFRGCKQSNFSTRFDGKGRNLNNQFLKKPRYSKNKQKMASGYFPLLRYKKNLLLIAAISPIFDPKCDKTSAKAVKPNCPPFVRSLSTTM